MLSDLDKESHKGEAGTYDPRVRNHTPSHPSSSATNEKDKASQRHLSQKSDETEAQKRFWKEYYDKSNQLKEADAESSMRRKYRPLRDEDFTPLPNRVAGLDPRELMDHLSKQMAKELRDIRNAITPKLAIDLIFHFAWKHKIAFFNAFLFIYEIQDSFTRHETLKFYTLFITAGLSDAPLAGTAFQRDLGIVINKELLPRFHGMLDFLREQKAMYLLSLESYEGANSFIHAMKTMLGRVPFEELFDGGKIPDNKGAAHFLSELRKRTSDEFGFEDFSTTSKIEDLMSKDYMEKRIGAVLASDKVPQQTKDDLRRDLEKYNIDADELEKQYIELHQPKEEAVQRLVNDVEEEIPENKAAVDLIKAVEAFHGEATDNNAIVPIMEKLTGGRLTDEAAEDFITMIEILTQETPEITLENLMLQMRGYILAHAKTYSAAAEYIHDGRTFTEYMEKEHPQDVLRELVPGEDGKRLVENDTVLVNTWKDAGGEFTPEENAWLDAHPYRTFEGKKFEPRHPLLIAEDRAMLKDPDVKEAERYADFLGRHEVRSQVIIATSEAVEKEVEEATPEMVQQAMDAAGASVEATVKEYLEGMVGEQIAERIAKFVGDRVRSQVGKVLGVVYQKLTEKLAPIGEVVGNVFRPIGEALWPPNIVKAVFSANRVLDTAILQAGRYCMKEVMDLSGIVFEGVSAELGQGLVELFGGLIYIMYSNFSNLLGIAVNEILKNSNLNDQQKAAISWGVNIGGFVGPAAAGMILKKFFGYKDPEEGVSGDKGKEGEEGEESKEEEGEESKEGEEGEESKEGEEGEEAGEEGEEVGEADEALEEAEGAAEGDNIFTESNVASDLDNMVDGALDSFEDTAQELADGVMDVFPEVGEAAAETVVESVAAATTEGAAGAAAFVIPGLNIVVGLAIFVYNVYSIVREVSNAIRENEELREKRERQKEEAHAFRLRMEAAGSREARVKLWNTDPNAYVYVLTEHGPLYIKLADWKNKEGVPILEIYKKRVREMNKFIAILNETYESFCKIVLEKRSYIPIPKADIILYLNDDGLHNIEDDGWSFVPPVYQTSPYAFGGGAYLPTMTRAGYWEHTGPHLLTFQEKHAMELMRLTAPENSKLMCKDPNMIQYIEHYYKDTEAYNKGIKKHIRDMILQVRNLLARKQLLPSDEMSRKAEEAMIWNGYPTTLAVVCCALSCIVYSDNEKTAGFTHTFDYTGPSVIRGRDLRRKPAKPLPTGVHFSVDVHDAQSATLARIYVFEEQSMAVVAFRGTDFHGGNWNVLKNMLTDSMIFLTEFQSITGQKMYCHSGFLVAYQTIHEKLIDALNRIYIAFPTVSRTYFTGHSLGGALAQVARMYPESGDLCDGIITFGQPRVFGGSNARGQYALETGQKSWRIMNRGDMIWKLSDIAADAEAMKDILKYRYEYVSPARVYWTQTPLIYGKSTVYYHDVFVERPYFDEDAKEESMDKITWNWSGHDRNVYLSNVFHNYCPRPRSVEMAPIDTNFRSTTFATYLRACFENALYMLKRETEDLRTKHLFLQAMHIFHAADADRSGMVTKSEFTKDFGKTFAEIEEERKEALDREKEELDKAQQEVDEGSDMPPKKRRRLL